MNNLSTAIESIHDIPIAMVADEYLDVIKTSREWVCPKCGNGTHDSKTGITVVPNSDRLFCFACKESFDAIEIVRYKEKCDFGEAIRILGGRYGIDLNSGRQSYRRPKTSSNRSPELTNSDNKKSVSLPENALSLNDERSIAGANYLNARGITIETANKLGISYCPAWQHPKNLEKFGDKPYLKSPRLIIPNGNQIGEISGYDARDIRAPQDIPDGQTGYTKQKYGSTGLTGLFFLLEALESNGIVFATEGWADCASIIEHGYSAISLNSTGNKELLIKILDGLKENGTDTSKFKFIDALDNDESGRNTSEWLRVEFEKRGLEYFSSFLPDKYNDINELHVEDRKQLATWLNDSYIHAKKSKPRLSETDEKELQIIYSMNHLYDILEYCKSEHPPIHTGFYKLDIMLEGGLDPYLHILGASTGIGKTAFSMQIADHVAASGIPTLIIALEMSRKELIARSLARIMDDNLGELKRKFGHDIRALSANEILRGTADHTTTQARILDELACMHKGLENLYIYESGWGTSVDKIRRLVSAIYHSTGKYPFVLIDYLQLMKSPDTTLTGDEKLTEIVSDCKRLSRDTDMPVWLISSFNRVGTKANGNGSRQELQAAGKGSGSIEYGADVYLGLYPTDDTGKIVDCRLLKGRWIAPKGKLRFGYNGRSSKYTDLEFIKEKESFIP